MSRRHATRRRGAPGAALAPSVRQTLKAYLTAVEVQAELLMRSEPPMVSAGDYEGDMIDAGARLATAFVRRNQFCVLHRHRPRPVPEKEPPC
jgi:hypothetical protein